MHCVQCGKEIDEKASVCVCCGAAIAKKKAKKPFYKKWWFWVIVSVLVIGIVSGSAGEDGKKTPIGNGTPDQTASQTSRQSLRPQSAIEYKVMNLQSLLDA